MSTEDEREQNRTTLRGPRFQTFRRQKWDRPKYGISVEEFLRRKRREEEKKLRLLGEFSTVEDVAHAAQARPGASYGGRDW